MTALGANISELEIKRFWYDGYLVLPGLASPERCVALRQIATDHLKENIAPVEYEAEVQYPGSPASLESEGGGTVRRLLHAYSRHTAFRDWSTDEQVAETLRQLMQANQVCLSQCHHNCIMTKQPGYSSATLWHQDNRYWSFDEENLISVWLALGDETVKNGCLRVIPGSHTLQLDRGRYDAAQFLRPDLQENKELISASRVVELNEGDVLFFHSRLFHAAGRNLTDEVKFSAVFTYHEAGNRPIEGTRSARYASVPI